MHQLMNHYHKAPDSVRPRIIGLTGMLISGSVKPSSVVDELKSLESTFHATVSTVQSFKELNNVLLFSTNPKETLIRYQDMPSDDSPAIKRITSIVAGFVEKIERWPIDITHQRTNSYKLKGELTNLTKFLRTLFKDFVYQMMDMGK